MASILFHRFSDWLDLHSIRFSIVSLAVDCFLIYRRFRLNAIDRNKQNRAYAHRAYIQTVFMMHSNSMVNVWIVKDIPSAWHRSIMAAVKPPLPVLLATLVSSRAVVAVVGKMTAAAIVVGVAMSNFR